MPSPVSKLQPPTPIANDSADGWHYVQHHDPQSSHQQILKLVRQRNAGPLLDVGAAQGMLGQALLDTGIDADAVEPHPRWAEHARQFYRRVFATPIEDAPLPIGAYATIVCADVLEHTVDPLAVLRHLRLAARPGAIVIVSLPNVAHLSARLFLLTGRWPQMERGIFDRTHLHFYTRETAEALLRDAGLRVVRVRPTPVPLGMVWPRRAGAGSLQLAMAAQRAALLAAPRLFAFQWIFVAQVP